jgi:SOS response regulatory protein OraA/RecX
VSRTGREAALALAGRELGRRDLSCDALVRRLETAGVDAALARATADDLAADGLLDDRRAARARASVLAERGLGNSAIAERLEREGFRPAALDAALSGLPPEADRARLLAAAVPHRAPRRVAESLYRHGFAEEAIEAALAALDAPPDPALR